MSKKGLGRGLESLIPVETIQDGERVEMLSIAEIEPNRYQPRRDFDQEKLEELAESIRNHGVVQPIIVRPLRPGYELIAGERRWRAAQLAGLTEIPAVVRSLSDGEAMEIALIENIQRQDLNPIEEARAFQRLIAEFSLTQDEVAKRVARSRPQVTNTLRLLQLSPEIQEYVSRGTLSMGHARALLSLNLEQQTALVTRVIKEGLSVRQVEESVKRQQEAMATVTAKQKRTADSGSYRRWENELKQRLSTQVRITRSGKKGKIEVEFFSEDDLERILEILIDSKE